MLSLIAFILLLGVAATPEHAPDLANNPPPVYAPLNPALPTIFVAGDSTAARGAGARQQGWAVPFADYFDPAKVNVANRARGGRSSRSYYTEGSWARLLDQVKPGDVVLIQFGHNDATGALNIKRGRNSLPGLGEETQTMVNITTHQPETVHTFGWYMRKYISDAQAKGATPIVVSPTVRNVWPAPGKIERGPGEYAELSKEIALAAHVPYVELTAVIADKFEAMGQAATAALYQHDHTHFNAIGADLHAQVVVAGLKALKPSPVAGWLSAKGRAVASGAP